jgi:YegS/Rv2252/BmrU family lipid kinase
LTDFTFIVNPKAGKGSTTKILGALESILRAEQISHETFLTERAGHATDLAASASSPVVVAVGGDGTVNEVANGLMSTAGKTLGIIPTGSGNDLIKSVGIPHNLRAAVDVLLRRRVRLIDVGTVACSENSSPAQPASTRPRYFVNGIGAGFDAAVAARTQEIHYLGGTFLYVAAVFQTLGKYSSPEYSVVIDGTEWRSENLLMAIGNGRCAGGGFYLTPDAVIDDGLLDVCLVTKASVPRILMLMPSVMRGKHHKAKEVKFLRGKRITISSECPFYVHADGEIVGRGVRSVSVVLGENRLSVIAA